MARFAVAVRSTGASVALAALIIALMAAGAADSKRSPAGKPRAVPVLTFVSSSGTTANFTLDVDSSLAGLTAAHIVECYDGLMTTYLVSGYFVVQAGVTAYAWATEGIHGPYRSCEAEVRVFFTQPNGRPDRVISNRVRYLEP